MRFDRWLVVAAFVWPVVLAGAVVGRVTGHGEAWAAVVYLAASRVCHQLPARSFATAGIPWPVCGRCAGLYLAAPAGALLAIGRRAGRAIDLRAVLAVASVPTIVTIALEWSHAAPMDNLARALAALPLGAAVAFAIVRVAAPPHEPGDPDRARRRTSPPIRSAAADRVN